MQDDDDDDDDDDKIGFLGKNFNYARKMKSPAEMDMKISGDMAQLGDNVGSLVSYITALISGPSNAISSVRRPGGTGNNARPLGNSYFLPTVATCRNINNNGESVPRSIFVNNIPLGNIPILSGITEQNMTNLRGLVPGVVSNMNILNPMNLINTLTSGGNAPCVHVTLPTINNEGRVVQNSSGFLTLADIESIDPCAITQVGNLGNSGPNFCEFNKRNFVEIKNPKYSINCGRNNKKCVCTTARHQNPSCRRGGRTIPPDMIINGFRNMSDNTEEVSEINKKFQEIIILFLVIIGISILIKTMHKKK